MTILYSAKKCLGYAVVFKGNGSVLFQPRTLFSACVSGFVAAICSFHRVKKFVADGVGNPEIFFSAVGFVLGFVLVYRAQEAYQRYWTATKDTSRMFSHLRSMALMIRTFTPNVSLQLHFMTRLRVFAIIACDLLRARPTDYEFLLNTKLLTPDDALLLIGRRNRAAICLTWLGDLIAIFISATHKLPKEKKGSPLFKQVTEAHHGHSYIKNPESLISFVTDPQLGLLYSELNEARLSFEQAEVVSDIPYPFPYVFHNMIPFSCI